MRITYLGQCGVLLSGSRTVLIDPYLSYSVDEATRSRSMPWVRAYPPPVAAEDVHGIDLVLLSHAHTDHTDPGTLPAISKASPEALFIGPPPVRDKLKQLGISEDRVICPEVDTPMLGVRAIPAAHEQLHPLEQGYYAEYGYIIELDGIRLYHSGDCCPYDGLQDRLKALDAALLPVNGRDAFRLRDNCIGNFHPEEAVRLCAECGIPALMPLHHDLYAANGMSVERVACLRDIFAPSLRLLTPRPGHGVDIRPHISVD